MSCSCCCYVSPSGELLEGIRKKERLVRDREEEEEAEGGGEEESRRNMDISLLREQYRCTKEKQRRHTQVLLFRTVSEQLSEAISVVPVTQGLTSPWEPNRGPPPVATFDLDPTSYDPWHVHLGLHKRFCPGMIVQLTPSSPETTNTNSSSRRWSSSTDAVSSRLDVESTSESLSSSRATSPFHCTKEADNTETSRGEPGSESSERSGGPLEKTCPVRASVSEQNPNDGSKQDHPAGSLTSSDESSTPVASITCSHSSSTTNIHEADTSQLGRQTSNTALQNSSNPAWRGSRKFMTPTLRLTRQLSVGGLGSSSTGVYQTQNYQPFPHRKTPRISEAAKRLGMYSSF